MPPFSPVLMIAELILNQYSIRPIAFDHITCDEQDDQSEPYDQREKSCHAITVITDSVNFAKPYAGVILLDLSVTQPNENRAKINAAVEKAKTWFAANRAGRNCRFLIQLPKGRFEVGLNSNIPESEGVINLTGVRTYHDTNWVIFRGWGHDERNINHSTLVTSVKNHTILTGYGYEDIVRLSTGSLGRHRTGNRLPHTERFSDQSRRR